MIPTGTSKFNLTILTISDLPEIPIPRAASSWLYVTPFGIRKMMSWIQEEYGATVPVYITENGFSDRIGNLDDMQREYFYKHYINQLLKCEL